MHPHRIGRAVVALGLLLVAGEAGAAPEKKGPSKKELKAAEEQLAENYRRWLDVVYFLISEEERVAFLQLEKDYQRDAFIERFWKIRDPYPDSGRNEFREHWMSRIEFVLEEFGDLREDRSRYFLMNGPPTARYEFNCTAIWPIDAWFYDGSERVRDEFFLLFVRRFGINRWTLWRPTDGIDELLQNSVASFDQVSRDLYSCKDGDVLVRILRFITRGNAMDFEMLLARIERPTEAPSGEWVETFNAYSTDLPEGAALLPAELTIDFPERYQNRTVVAGTVEVSVEDAGRAELGAAAEYDFLLTGEVLKDGALFENFRYKFDFPVSEIAGERIPILFHRRLRPGTYTLVLKVEDVNSGRIFREQREIEVPHLDRPGRPLDEATRKVLAAAEAVLDSDETTVQIVELHGEMHTGMVRFDTLTTGQQAIDEMRFILDDTTTLRKRRPPFSVELDLGAVPRPHVLRVEAVDAEGTELAVDEIEINAGKHRFDVRLVEPRKGIRYQGEVEAIAETLVPEDKLLERVEFFVNETLVATLYQPPYVQTVALPAAQEIAYVEAIAYLTDGNATRDGVFVNGPAFMEEVAVEYVELYATVLDKDQRPLQDLSVEEFTVLEDGVEQEIRRFEKVDNLPIHAQVMIDVSASMEENMEATKRAALRFFEATITPKDRAALITFNDHPLLVVNFTNDHGALAGGLAGLAAERGTALYDSLIFGLYYLNGIKGQRALLLLSDGKDESSRFSWENTLEYARRAGVAIYAIGLDIKGKGAGDAKRKLSRLAEETGGRHFFLQGVEGLDQVYASIQEELRSRYLLTYQSSNDTGEQGFRTVDLQVERSGAEAKTMRGYYP